MYMHNYAVTFKLGRSGENQWCAVIFSLIYFPTVASLVWFVILTYTWFVTQRRTDPQCARQVLDKQRSFFHLAAWCLPLVLSVACLTIAKVKHSTFLKLQGVFMHYVFLLFIAQIDGDSLSGICFVGHSQFAYRTFIFAPVAVALVVGLVFVAAGRSRVSESPLCLFNNMLCSLLL